MNEIFTAVISVLVGGGAFWGLVKSGLIKIQIGGVNGEGKIIREHLEKLESNDLVHLDSKLERIMDKLDKMIECSNKLLFIMEDLRENLKK